MRRIQKIGLHLVLICLVVLVPPLLYERLVAAGVTDVLLLFIGALTYPLYMGYWIMRIQQPRMRIPLLHLLSFVVVVVFCVLGLDSHVNTIVCVVGVPAVLLIGLIFALVELFRRKRVAAMSHFLGFMLLFSMALFTEYLILSAISMSVMKGLRY
ncbi:membrane protein of unknown function (plasmid) [Ralstonia solanacearum CMR15]|nr:membrane protein of unknown function [Ralstonia solanacearum CMR15]